MKNRLAVVVVASTLALGACTTAGSSPATAPTVTRTSITPASTAIATTTLAPATTTTIDRIAEIEAIFRDLEVRRLRAIMDQDEEAFRAVFANDEYAERSVEGMNLVLVIDPTLIVFTILDLHIDEPACIAVTAQKDGTLAIDDAGVSEPMDYVVESDHSGIWGISWIGSGWRCDGPHPFSE